MNKKLSFEAQEELQKKLSEMRLKGYTTTELIAYTKKFESQENE